eukprot:scaffold182711_cov18-Prasinocladus_malaysianus.AAC.1
MKQIISMSRVLNIIVELEAMVNVLKSGLSHEGALSADVQKARCQLLSYHMKGADSLLCPDWIAITAFNVMRIAYVDGSMARCLAAFDMQKANIDSILPGEKFLGPQRLSEGPKGGSGDAYAGRVGSRHADRQDHGGFPALGGLTDAIKPIYSLRLVSLWRCSLREQNALIPHQQHVAVTLTTG